MSPHRRRPTAAPLRVLAVAGRVLLFVLRAMLVLLMIVLPVPFMRPRIPAPPRGDETEQVLRKD
ncbi:MAG: hypothetical protein ACK4N5_07155 [Myxococcales bacterium]